MDPRAPGRTDGYAPLRDYAVIGDKRTAALVALDGSIDWLPLAGFDGPSVFAALLDPRKGGAFELSPAVPFTAERRYLPETNVLETTFRTAEGAIRVTDAMSLPVARPLPWSEIVRRVDALAGRVPLRWHVHPRFDYGRVSVEPRRVGDVPCFEHGRAVLSVHAYGAGAVQLDDASVQGATTLREGQTAVLAVLAFDDEPTTLCSAGELLRRLDGTVEHWRTRSTAEDRYDGPWSGAVRRSALALDLLIDRDTGAVAAAATTSLPERIGGDRNYDYRYGWLRDSNLTLEAMQRLGYREQVHASLRWMHHAIRATLPRMQVMYLLGGGADVPGEHELDLAGYRGSRPVRRGNGATGQLQLGNWGDVFDMAHHFVDDGHALGPGTGERLARNADELGRLWREPDASIWELPEPRQHTQSKLASWLAFHRAGELAAAGHMPGSKDGWHARRDAVEQYVETCCWSEDLRAYARAADALDQLDAGVLLAARGRYIERHAERFVPTIAAIRRELGAGGPLVYRTTELREQEGAFLACSFWVAEALARTGRVDEAAEMVDALVALGNDVGLYTEEIDPCSGELLGNLPQALTHLALINAANVIRAS